MRRIIVDYSKLNDELLARLVEAYPSGYDASDIIIFRNAQNEVIECVEVRTEDTVYLVKVSKRLVAAMEDYELDDDDDNDSDESEDYEEAEVDDFSE